MYYYCPKCKEYARKITEIYSKVKECREWDGLCYELKDTSLNEPDQILCYECNTEVIEHRKRED